MAQNKDQRTEKPTSKRIRDARKEGRIARSRDLTMAFSTLAVTGALAMAGPSIVRRLMGAVSGALTGLAHLPGRGLQAEDLTSMVMANGALIAMLVGPLALIAAASGVSSNVAQGGFHYSSKALHPKWGNLSPLRGIHRLAPSQSGLDTLKTAVTVTVLGIIAYRITKTLAADALRFAWMPPAGSAGQGWDAARRTLWQGGLALLAIGGADYALQRRRLTTSLKMTKQEVRDERRMMEGSPEIKGQVRRAQRDMFRRRMLHATAKATVVITNPTHYAVALEYRRERNVAPVVVAKGQNLLALRIREIARLNGVPIVENPPLARALHLTVEVGDTIPSELFGAVAEVLAYLIRIKQLML